MLLTLAPFLHIGPTNLSSFFARSRALCCCDFALLPLTILFEAPSLTPLDLATASAF